MAWIVAPMMIEESIFIRLICLIVIEGGHVVEAIGMTILLTVAIPRIVSRIVTTVVESILYGLIGFCIFASFIAIEEGVAVLVMERSVVIIMRKAWATRILVAIVAVTGLSPGNCIFFSSLIGLGIFSDSVLLLLLILGIVIEGWMAFEVRMFIVVVMAVIDAGSVSVLMIIKGIFLGSFVVIEGRVALEIGVFVVMVMAVIDARSVAVLMIVEGIFL